MKTVKQRVQEQLKIINKEVPWKKGETVCDLKLLDMYHKDLNYFIFGKFFEPGPTLCKRRTRR